jgi:hypothetical protein
VIGFFESDAFFGNDEGVNGSHYLGEGCALGWGVLQKVNVTRSDNTQQLATQLATLYHNRNKNKRKKKRTL